MTGNNTLMPIPKVHCRLPKYVVSAKSVNVLAVMNPIRFISRAYAKKKDKQISVLEKPDGVKSND